MKRFILVLTMLAVFLFTASALAETAYPTIALNSADYGIGSVYMAESMITTQAINPMTVAPYTEDEIAALKAGESIELDEGCVLALSVNGSDVVFMYDAEDAAAILSHADPLVLNPESGEVTTMDGEYVIFGQTGFIGITLDSADYGIGSVYYAADYFTTDHINPMTVAPYTDEEIEAVLSGEGVGMPSWAVIGISVNGTDTIFFYGAEDAAKILASADPLKLNADNGEITTMDGTVVVPAE